VGRVWSLLFLLVPVLGVATFLLAPAYHHWLPVDVSVPGEGAVIKKGLKPVAVYRDESGQVSACSAVCVHLGCIVQWNSEEKTFDCPCHGSRFTHHGKVINGPANKDLETAELPEPTKE